MQGEPVLSGGHLTLVAQGKVLLPEKYGYSASVYILKYQRIGVGPWPITNLVNGKQWTVTSIV